MAAPKAITPVTSLATAPEAMTADEVYKAEPTGNAITVYGKCTNGSGNLYLFRWDSSVNKWFLVDGDARGGKSVEVDSTKPSGTVVPGHFAGTWMVGDGIGAWYLLLKEGTPTLGDCRIAQIGL